MTREPVLFRVDGTSATGWENLCRCLVFAQALQRRRRPCHFLSQLQPDTLAPKVRRGDNSWIEASFPAGSADDLEEVIQEVRRIRPAAIIVDAPNCGPEYLAELSVLGPVLVSLDSYAPYRFASQLVINPTLNAAIEDYDVCPGTQVLAGHRYVLVRPEIRRIRPMRAQEPTPPYRVLIAMGDDPACQTSRLIPLLMSIKKVSHIDLIVRPQHQDFPKWQAFAEADPEQITISSEIAAIANKVAKCHLAIADCNAWAMELACVGVPLMLIVQDHADTPSAQILEEEGIALCLGSAKDVADSTIINVVQHLLHEPKERLIMARAGRAFFDGRGPDRLVTALEIMLHPSRQIGLSEAA